MCVRAHSDICTRVCTEQLEERLFLYNIYVTIWPHGVDIGFPYS